MTGSLPGLVGPGVIFVAAVVFFVLAGQGDSYAEAGQLSAAFWPRMVLAFLMISCVAKAWTMISRLRFHARTAVSPVPEVGSPLRPGPTHDQVGWLLNGRQLSSIAANTIAETEEPGPEVDRRKLLAGIALIAGFVVGTEVMGFPLACFLFLVGFIYIGGWRRPVSLVALALAGTVGALYVFVKIVYLPLPKGIGPFEDLTVMLYRVLGVF